MSGHISITIPVKDENTDQRGNKAPPTDRPLSAEEQEAGMAARTERNTQVIETNDRAASLKAPLIDKGRDEMEAAQMKQEAQEGNATLGDLLLESLQGSKETYRLEAKHLDINDPTVFAASSEVTGFESEAEMVAAMEKVDPSTGQKMMDHEPAYRVLIEAKLLKTNLGADGRLVFDNE